MPLVLRAYRVGFGKTPNGFNASPTSCQLRRGLYSTTQKRRQNERYYGLLPWNSRKKAPKTSLILRIKKVNKSLQSRGLDASASRRKAPNESFLVSDCLQKERISQKWCPGRGLKPDAPRGSPGCSL